MNERITGTVKWLNTAKGYGFIGHEGGEDVFVHYSSIQPDGNLRLDKDQMVEFSIEAGSRSLQTAKIVPL